MSGGRPRPRCRPALAGAALLALAFGPTTQARAAGEDPAWVVDLFRRTCLERRTDVPGALEVARSLGPRAVEARADRYLAWFGELPASVVILHEPRTDAHPFGLCSVAVLSSDKVLLASASIERQFGWPHAVQTEAYVRAAEKQGGAKALDGSLPTLAILIAGPHDYVQLSRDTAANVGGGRGYRIEMLDKRSYCLRPAPRPGEVRRDTPASRRPPCE